jgi:hypothetical protein
MDTFKDYSASVMNTISELTTTGTDTFEGYEHQFNFGFNYKKEHLKSAKSNRYYFFIDDNSIDNSIRLSYLTIKVNLLTSDKI